MQLVAYETEVSALAVNLAHTCTALEGDTVKATRTAYLEKKNNLLKEDLVEERHLKEGSSPRLNLQWTRSSFFPAFVLRGVGNSLLREHLGS